MRTPKRRNSEVSFATRLRRELKLVGPVVLASQSELVKGAFLSVVRFSELRPSDSVLSFRKAADAVMNAGYDAAKAYRIARSDRTKAVADIVRKLCNATYQAYLEEMRGGSRDPTIEFRGVRRSLEIAMGVDPEVRERAAYERALLDQSERIAEVIPEPTKLPASEVRTYLMREINEWGLLAWDADVAMWSVIARDAGVKFQDMVDVSDIGEKILRGIPASKKALELRSKIAKSLVRQVRSASGTDLLSYDQERRKFVESD